MMISRKNFYLIADIVMLLVFLVYTYLQDSGLVTWLPSDERMPITDTVIDFILFISVVTLSSFRFKIVGGIIASMIGLLPIVWCHKYHLVEVDVWVELMIFLFEGIVLTLVIVRYQATLHKVKVLEAMLPICSSCKKIRDAKGEWQQPETYISGHTDTEFTHGLCPECMVKIYGEEMVSKMKAISAASKQKKP